jgi:hypothetical protein
MLAGMEKRKAAMPQLDAQETPAQVLEIAKKLGTKLKQDTQNRTDKLQNEIQQEVDDRQDIKNTQSKMAVSVEKGTDVFEGIGDHFTALVALEKAKSADGPAAMSGLQAQVALMHTDIGEIKSALTIMMGFLTDKGGPAAAPKK